VVLLTIILSTHEEGKVIPSFALSSGRGKRNYEFWLSSTLKAYVHPFLSINMEWSKSFLKLYYFDVYIYLFFRFRAADNLVGESTQTGTLTLFITFERQQYPV